MVDGVGISWYDVSNPEFVFNCILDRPYFQFDLRISQPSWIGYCIQYFDMMGDQDQDMLAKNRQMETYLYHEKKIIPSLQTIYI